MFAKSILLLTGAALAENWYSKDSANEVVQELRFEAEQDDIEDLARMLASHAANNTNSTNSTATNSTDVAEETTTAAVVVDEEDPYVATVSGNAVMGVSLEAACDTTEEMASDACADLRGAMTSGLCKGVKAYLTGAAAAALICEGDNATFAASYNVVPARRGRALQTASTVTATYVITIEADSTAGVDTLKNAMVTQVVTAATADPTAFAAAVLAQVVAEFVADGITSSTPTSVQSFSEPTASATTGGPATTVDSFASRAVAAFAAVGAVFLL